MVIGWFGRQKGGHRCTSLGVILLFDLSLSPQSSFNPKCPQEKSGVSVNHSLLTAAQSAIHIFANKLFHHFLSIVICSSVCLFHSPSICVSVFRPQPGSRPPLADQLYIFNAVSHLTFPIAWQMLINTPFIALLRVLFD